MDEAAVRAELRGWILDRANAHDRKDFNDQSDVLEEGLLSSLDVVELILFIESLRGDEVDIDLLEPEAFTCVDSIFLSFFTPSNA